MFITQSRGRKVRIPFSENAVRGLRIEGLELEYSDIKTMLNMDERQLKDHLYTILCSMENSEHFRYIDHRRSHPSSDDFRWDSSSSPSNPFGLPDENAWPEMSAKNSGLPDFKKEMRNFKIPNRVDFSPSPSTVEDDELIWSGEE